MPADKKPRREPQSIQATLGAEPPAFTWNGKTWRVGFETQDAKARYEELIAQEEVGSVEALRAISPAEADRRLVAVSRAIRAGAHATNGTLWAEYTVGANRAVGLVLFVLALMRDVPGQEGVTLDDVKAILATSEAGARLALERAVPGFLALTRAYLAAAGATPADLARVDAEITAATAALPAALTPG